MKCVLNPSPCFLPFDLFSSVCIAVVKTHEPTRPGSSHLAGQSNDPKLTGPKSKKKNRWEKKKLSEQMDSFELSKGKFVQRPVWRLHARVFRFHPRTASSTTEGETTAAETATATAARAAAASALFTLLFCRYFHFFFLSSPPLLSYSPFSPFLSLSFSISRSEPGRGRINLPASVCPQILSHRSPVVMHFILEISLVWVASQPLPCAPPEMLLFSLTRVKWRRGGGYK